MSFARRVSASGTDTSPELAELQILPRGSALITSSGALADDGIEAIVHAATGSMTRTGPTFDPTLDSIALSIRNAFELMRLNGFDRIAIPFLASGIFLGRIGVAKSDLAAEIVRACRDSCRPDEACVLVIFGDQDAAMFHDLATQRSNNGSTASITVAEGSLIDFSLHECPVIVNAANMEVEFGAGLSGVIAAATGAREAIDLEARQAIDEYYAED